MRPRLSPTAPSITGQNDTYRPLHPSAADDAPFSRWRGTVTTLWAVTLLNTLKRTETWSVCSQARRSHTRHQQKIARTPQYPDIGNTRLNNTRVKEEISREIIKYFELHENESSKFVGCSGSRAWRGFTEFNAYIRDETPIINNVSFYTRTLENKSELNPKKKRNNNEINEKRKRIKKNQ